PLRYTLSLHDALPIFHRMKRFVLLALLTLAAPALAVDETADATAKFLAGLPVRGTPLGGYSLDPSWASHATDFDKAWVRLEQQQDRKSTRLNSSHVSI